MMRDDLSLPIAEGSLEQGKSRDRGGVGAQNTRAKRQADGVRQTQQRLALGRIEPPFRTDENGELARYCWAAAGTQYLVRVFDRRRLIAKNEEAIPIPFGEKGIEPHGWRDIRNGQNTALLGGLDRMEAHTFAIDARRLGPARDDWAQQPSPHFHGFFNHIILARMFERRKKILERGWRLLRPGHYVNSERYAFTIGGGNAGFPFAILTIENEDFRAFR